MRLFLRLAGVLCLLVGSAASTAGQTLQFYNYPDTTLTVVRGDSNRTLFQISGVPTGGLGRYGITFFFDNARVQLIRADSVLGSAIGKPTITAAGDSAHLAWTAPIANTVSGTVSLANVWFKVLTGAVEGSLVSTRVDSLRNAALADIRANHSTTVLNLCQANTYWGDVTGDHQITSRDALVALTGAVGLPTTGFDLSPGDVDGDSVVTSRDALLILNYAIRLYTGSARLGTPKANRCAPLTPVPNDMLFYRYTQLFRIMANDTVPVKLTLPNVPDYSWRAVWSPDGQRVLYTQYVGAPAYSYYEIMSSTSPFAKVDTLTRSPSYYDVGADWSPDGRRIAFMSDRVSPPAVFKMDANGLSPTQLSNSSVTASVGQAVSFHPDGNRIAFVGYQTSLCCNTGIWVTHADSSFAIQEQVLSGTAVQSPTDVSWNALGDSIYYRNGATGQLFVVPYFPPVASPATGVPASRLYAGHDNPAATSVGPAFRSTFTYPYDFFMRRTTNGRHLRILRGTTNGEYRPSFRRNSSYIQTVAVSPQSQSVAVSASFTATATVTNANPTGPNTTAPVTWISRNTGIATVSPTGVPPGPLTASITGVATGSTYVVVTTGGWRSDSVLVSVP